MAKRLTATDYRAEFNHQTTQLAGLKKRIELRFKTLCEQNPDVALYSIPDLSGKTLSTPVCAKEFIQNNKPVATLDTDAQITFIAIIEKHLADQHPHKQAEFTCNCDGRDMPTYVEDGKRWCPQCGYQVI
jgi:hypothetical protein